MNDYGNMLLIAMPIFLLLIILEMIWGKWKHGEDQNIVDSVSSISSGMTNILKATLGLSIVIISYPWLMEHLSVVHWEKGSFWPYVITFVFIDFAGYWAHRLQHRVNFFWSHHVIHHSSEEFNLPCALRQQISVLTNVYTTLMLPLAIIGIPGEVLAIVGPIHLFSQFWYHTRYIGKLGFLEHILVTPSHHRVHHAMNDIYMDKNYSQIFIIWDKMFGSFQEEMPDENCVYGMRRPAQTWNPFIINYKHWWQLAADAWHTKNWRDKFRVWFMPTGWRPADVVEKYPVYTVSSMQELKKFNPGYSGSFTIFTVVHLTVVFLLLCFLFFRFGEISKSEALVCGLLLLFSIFSFTAFLDKTMFGTISMVIAAATITGFALNQGDWFGLNEFLPAGSIFIPVYFVFIGLLALWFYKSEFSVTT